MTLLTDAPDDQPADNAPSDGGTPPADNQQPPADAAGAAGQGKGGDQGQGADQGKADGAPESYDWKLPEGVNFDEGGLEAFADFAKGAGLNNEQANALLGKLAPAIAERQQAAHVAMIDGWINGAQADTEFGGPQLQQNLAVAKKAIDQFGTPELTKLLNETGLGNHPEIVRAFYRAGKAISEDRFVGGGKPGAGSVDPAKRMFPNMN